MFHAPREFEQVPEGRARGVGLLAAFDARWPGARRRAGSLALALLLEGGLLLLLLTLGRSVGGQHERGESLTTIDFAPDAPREQTPERKAETRPRALPQVAPRPRPPSPDRPTPSLPIPVPLDTPPLPSVIPLSKNVLPAQPAGPPKAKAVIRDDMSGPVGPPDTGTPGDSERIAGASGPDGEPLYRARWYREPYPEELSGYLSTASGPGWALINCKTEPGFRVDQCVLVDEYPDNAGIGRAVLAAAWQFKVRPPQVGGRVLVGEWVRIRITYEEKRAPATRD